MWQEKNRWHPRISVAAIIEREGLFLIVEEETYDGLRLNNPTGHFEAGESLIKACARETLEETGWDFIPTALLGIYTYRFNSSRGDDLTYMRFAFKGDLGQFDPKRELDTGIVRTLWMSYEELLNTVSRHRTPLLLQCVDAYRQGLSFPLEVLTTNSSVYQL